MHFCLFFVRSGVLNSPIWCVTESVRLAHTGLRPRKLSARSDLCSWKDPPRQFDNTAKERQHTHTRTQSLGSHGVTLGVIWEEVEEAHVLMWKSAFSWKPRPLGVRQRSPEVKSKMDKCCSINMCGNNQTLCFPESVFGVFPTKLYRDKCGKKRWP